MNRFIMLMGAGIMLVIFSSFFQNGVTVSMTMPDVIEAGTEVTVNVTVNKGALTDFARFQQELPVGFTARAVNSANADFSFQDQKVRLVWLRVPDDNEINFSYKIIANERLTGSINLGGQYTYIDDNERKSVDTQPVLLAINSSPTVDSAKRVDVRDYAKVASIESVAAGAGQTVALRQHPVWMAEDRIFLVNLLINRDAVQKFAKIEEAIPDGYAAASVDSKNGIFTFKDQTAKIIWLDLPSDPYFTVTYKLIPKDATVTNPELKSVAGVFSFMIDDRTYYSSITERRETLVGLGHDQLSSLLSSVNIQATEQPILVSELATSPQPDTAPPAGTISQTPPASARQPATTARNDADNMLEPETGIYYRIQIAAGHNEVNVQRYFRNYRLEHAVKREIHEEWYKYTVGSFAEYRDARDYRVHISNTAKIADAFVAAYNNDKRITVQDALMALNQKWYK